MEPSIEFYTQVITQQILPERRWIHKALAGWRKHAQRFAYWILERLGSFTYGESRICRNQLTISKDLQEAVRLQVDEHYRRGGGIIPAGDFTILVGPDIYTELLKIRDPTSVPGVTLPYPTKLSHSVEMSEELRGQHGTLISNGYSHMSRDIGERNDIFRKVLGMKIRIVPHMKGLLVLQDEPRGNR